MQEIVYFAINPARMKSRYKVCAGLSSETVISADEDAFDAVANLLSTARQTADGAQDSWRDLFRIPENSLGRKSRLYAVPGHILNHAFDGATLRKNSIEVTGLQ